MAFAVGAVIPGLDGFWGMSDEEGARWIVNHPGSWQFTSIAFIASLVMCIIGLAIFTDTILKDEAQVLGKIGFYAFFIGGIFWVINMGFRLSVLPYTARILVETGAVPEYLIPLRLWEAILSRIFKVLTFLASSIYGLALLRSGKFSGILGWFAIGYGIYGVLFDPIPITVLVVPLALGLSNLPKDD